MKARYFNAESYEIAEEMAAKYFLCKKEDMTIDVITGEEGSDFWSILAIYGKGAGVENMNGGYGLFYEKDGVYLEIYAKRGEGAPLDKVELLQHLKRKNTKDLDSSAVLALIAKGFGRSKVAPSQEEFFFGEDLLVEIMPSELEASVVLLAPERKGGMEVSLQEAKEKLEQAGVIKGIDEDRLIKALAAKNYGNSIVVAKAELPINGENGRCIFHFNTEMKRAKPKEIEGGKVDYRTLDLFESVDEGQLLVTRVLATPGIPGITVKGREIAQKPGREVSLPKSKNTIISDDKLYMYSKLTGLVEYVGGSVNVSNVYNVEGDCNMGVGNIDFDGSVYISGNVMSGLVIKATGGIIIGGVVEASEIKSGGNIEIKRGMQGMDKGRIEAAGSITIQYIERGTAVAGESITVDTSVHSTLEAGGSIYAKGKRGSIIGGLARVESEIVANSLGSVSHPQTEIEVGFPPAKRARMAELEKELEKYDIEKQKLEKIEIYLEKTRGQMVLETWEKLYRSMCENRNINNQFLRDYSEELNKLKADAENATEGRIHVFGTAYPGVKMMVATGVYRVQNEIEYSTFKLKDGEIVFIPCELSRR